MRTACSFIRIYWLIKANSILNFLKLPRCRSDVTAGEGCSRFTPWPLRFDSTKPWKSSPLLCDSMDTPQSSPIQEAASNVCIWNISSYMRCLRGMRVYFQMKFFAAEWTKIFSSFQWIFRTDLIALSGLSQTSLSTPWVQASILVRSPTLVHKMTTGNVTLTETLGR